MQNTNGYRVIETSGGSTSTTWSCRDRKWGSS